MSGALAESNPRIGGAHLQVLVSAGASFSFGPDHIHRLTGTAAQSVSIHAYSPPLQRMGQYSIDDEGLMRRVPTGYTDELRPIAAARQRAGIQDWTRRYSRPSRSAQSSRVSSA